MSKDSINWPEADKKRQPALGSRPFTILDAMVLIASSALGFMTMRLYAVALLQFELISHPTFPRLWLTAYRYLVVLLPLPFAWSFAGFVLCASRSSFPVEATDPTAGLRRLRSGVRGQCDPSHRLPDGLAAGRL